jgi:hypothetical protein
MVLKLLSLLHRVTEVPLNKMLPSPQLRPLSTTLKLLSQL